MTEPSILIVEDDENLLNLLGYNLEKAGFTCHRCSSGEEGLNELSRKNIDLVLLDVMLPGIDGFEVCRRIRQHQLYRDIPVIMLTAKGEEIDRILGFELGIDDYVVKPFSPRELALRIRAVLKRDRRQGGKVSSMLCSGPIEVDLARHTATLDGRELVLTMMEFKLLAALLKRKGEAQSRETLLSDVWDIDRSINTRTIDTHVTRLREKLGETGRMIKTVRGFGYKFEDDEGAANEG
ncbi:MAG: response regulator transcription factor [Chlorobiaceae bacterium]|nr:response regulator transcription factor [Chlorobiaceae bacterium]NTW10962.1 response regulator transcription factor [Chlorobiaceae bacterium]